MITFFCWAAGIILAIAVVGYKRLRKAFKGSYENKEYEKLFKSRTFNLPLAFFVCLGIGLEEVGKLFLKATTIKNPWRK